MPKILQLEPHVADLIAAGEVVERPASVAKELVENAIDAGASIITVEIKDGGMTFIRVTDNGSGIAPDDVETAFKRHATSKIHNAEGLEAIGTLGFRGEALAAIAAVSRIELTTREHSADASAAGVRLALEAGATKQISPIGCPEGTTIVVKDLFFNTPARLKFMKSNRTESAAVASAVLRAALSHPEVSVRFIKDGKSEYHTPGDSRADSCIYSLFGRDFSNGLVFAESEDDSIKVSGYVSKPDSYRGNRNFQFFIVNGRPIRSKTLGAALEQAYSNLLPSGRFPSCVLYIKTKLGDVDINIHPTKAEIKFLSDKQVFSAVYYAALGAIGAEDVARSAEPDALSLSDKIVGSIQPPSFSTAPSSNAGGGFKSMSADDFNKSYGKKKPGLSSKKYEPRDESFKPLFSSVDEDVKIYNKALFTDERSQTKQDNSELELFSTKHSFNIIGEAMKTYIIVEHDESLWFIDKHAAHERMHFNALKSGDYDPMSQSLIVPVVCRFGAEDVSVLLDNLELLDNLGFSVESFGEDSAAVRRIPTEIDIGDVETVLSEICQHFKDGNFVDSDRLDNIFAAIACGSSITAGSSSVKHELEELAARVLDGEITHCPHGRPVMFELTKAALDKEFGRI